MKKKQDKEELLTDDEILSRGATKGDEKILHFNLRPLTVKTLSQLKRNGILDDSNDLFQKTAAYGFVHSADKDLVGSVVNDKKEFLAAVDEWMEENFQHHAQMEPLAESMSKAFEEYAAAASSGQSPYKGNGSKN